MSYFAEVYRGFVRYVGSGSVIPVMNPVLMRIVDCTTSVQTTGSFGLGWIYQPASKTFYYPTPGTTVTYQDQNGNPVTGDPTSGGGFLGIPPDPRKKPAF